MKCLVGAVTSRAVLLLMVAAGRGALATVAPPAAPPVAVHDGVALTRDKGPDQVLPADAYTTWEANGRVRLRMGRDGDHTVAKEPPISVPGLLQRAATLWPHRPALSFKRGNEWVKVTYSEYLQNVRTVAKAFMALGLRRYHGVGIIGFNSPEWFYADLGAIFAGGIAFGIYTTNSPEACLYTLEASDADIVVVEDQKQLAKILPYREKLGVKIIQYSGDPADNDVISWEELMTLGDAISDEDLDERLRDIAINECCTLVFTSGTEGTPKAVMLSHDNLTWDAFAASSYLNLRPATERNVSYLPLSHVAAQLADIYLPIVVGAEISFAQKDALKGNNLVDTLKEVRPTVFLGVPRVWEKIHEKFLSEESKYPWIVKTLLVWAQAAALERNTRLMNGDQSRPFKYRFYRWLVLKRIKRAIGLDRAVNTFSAAAPISTDTKRFFMSIDIILADVFGMSECSGAHTLSKNTDFRIDSIGRTIPGAETRLGEPIEKNKPDAEILMRGRHVQMGYLKNREKTEEAMDMEEGWLRTGDIGTIDDQGFIRITSRKKELLITAGGENVAPVPIEDRIKAALPFVSNVIVIGDKLKFLSALVTLKTTIDKETGLPTDKLARIVKDETHIEEDTVTEVLRTRNENLWKKIKKGIDIANTGAPSNAQRVQKFEILPADFTIATGELGPTLKLKRSVVVEKYQDVINKIYSE